MAKNVVINGTVYSNIDTIKVFDSTTNLVSFFESGGALTSGKFACGRKEPAPFMETNEAGEEVDRTTLFETDLPFKPQGFAIVAVAKESSSTNPKQGTITFDTSASGEKDGQENAVVSVVCVPEWDIFSNGRPHQDAKKFLVNGKKSDRYVIGDNSFQYIGSLADAKYRLIKDHSYFWCAWSKG